jgi:GNAT superfamily N-acetyltransferase
MIIRDLNLNDSDEFYRIISLFYTYAGNDIPSETDIERLLNESVDQDRNMVFFGAFEGEKLVGIISMTFAESSYRVSPFAWCDDFYVEKDFRGRGVGTKLLEAASEIAKEKECSNILVGAGEKDDEALRFYESHGFIDLKCRLLSLPLE